MIKNKKVTNFKYGPLTFSFGDYHDKSIDKPHNNGNCRSQKIVGMGIRMQLRSLKECHPEHCQNLGFSRIHHQSQNCPERKAPSLGIFHFFKSVGIIRNLSIPSLNFSTEIEDSRVRSKYVGGLHKENKLVAQKSPQRKDKVH